MRIQIDVKLCFPGEEVSVLVLDAPPASTVRLFPSIKGETEDGEEKEVALMHKAVSIRRDGTGDTTFIIPEDLPFIAAYLIIVGIQGQEITAKIPIEIEEGGE